MLPPTPCLQPPPAPRPTTRRAALWDWEGLRIPSCSDGRARDETLWSAGGRFKFLTSLDRGGVYLKLGEGAKWLKGGEEKGRKGKQGLWRLTCFRRSEEETGW